MNYKIGMVVGVFDKKKARIELTARNENNRYRGEMAVLGSPRQADPLQDQQYGQTQHFLDRYSWKYFTTFNFDQYEDRYISESSTPKPPKIIIKRSHGTLFEPDSVRLIQPNREESFPKRIREKRTTLSTDKDIEFIIRLFLEFFLGKHWSKKRDEWLTIMVVREGRGDNQHFHMLIAEHPSINGLDHMVDAMIWVSEHSRCLKRIFPHDKVRLLERQNDRDDRMERIRNGSSTGRKMIDSKDFHLNLQEIRPTDVDKEHIIKYNLKELKQKDYSNYCLLVPGGPYFPVSTSSGSLLPRYINQ